MNVFEGARTYDPVKAGVPRDLTYHLGPPVPGERLDPLIKDPITLTSREFSDLVTIVRDGLLDQRVKNLCHLIPASAPSGLKTMVFEGCPGPKP